MKEGGGFDVTMVEYDGAEVCELIGIFMLQLIGRKYNSKNTELYRDDGLTVFKNVSGPASEKTKQKKNLTYQQQGENNKNAILSKNRKRNIMWFN